MTFLVRGLKRAPSGALAKAEIITSSKTEADELFASLQRLGFKAYLQYFSSDKPDDVRHLVLLRESSALGEEFFKGINLDVRA